MYWEKSIKRIFAIFVLLLTVFVCRSSGMADTLDRVVAKVNSEIITLSSVQDRFKVISQRVKSSSDNGLAIQTNQLMENALNSIIEDRLKVQEAKKKGYKVENESINKAFDEIIKNNNLSEEQFIIMLEKEGRSVDAYKNSISDQILASQIVRARMGKSFSVSNRQIKKYYNKHIKDYWMAPKVKVRHILFILEKKAPKLEIELKKSMAQKVLQRIKSGEKFSDLARKYSEDVSAHSGGDVGVVEKDSMVKEFEKVAFQLKVGEVSDIIVTEYGLHIIKCDAIYPSYTTPLKSVVEDIKISLRIKNQQKDYNKWINELKKNAYIEKNLFEDRPNIISNEGFKTKVSNDEGDNFFNNKLNRDSNLKRLQKIHKPISVIKGGKKEKSRHFRLIMNKMKYLKKMRADNKISENLYRKKKKELLENF